jgi:uncharacterized protein YdeI (YjbR/CyaY-like superfamily)
VAESVDAALATAGSTASATRSTVSYRIRFTGADEYMEPINVKRVAELTKLGLMHPAGVRAFEARKGDKTGIYAYEQRKAAKLPPEYQRQFRANKKAWEFFQSQPPWYRRTATYRVISAKQEETRLRRLAELIKDSEAGQPIKELRRTRTKK